MTSTLDYIKNSKYNHDDTFFVATQLYDSDIVKFIMYDLYGYEPDGMDELTMQNYRNGQLEFRDALIKRYKTCIITDDESDICEACHIVPYSECKNYKIDNGLLLSASLHKLFDKYALTIDALTHKVMIKDTNLYENYKRYDGKKIKNISKQTEIYLSYHNKKYWATGTIQSV